MRAIGAPEGKPAKAAEVLSSDSLTVSFVAGRAVVNPDPAPALA